MEADLGEGLEVLVSSSVLSLDRLFLQLLSNRLAKFDFSPKLVVVKDRCHLGTACGSGTSLTTQAGAAIWTVKPGIFMRYKRPRVS